MSAIESAKSIYRRILAADNETPRVLEFVRRGMTGRYDGLVLDVGCGYGRTLRGLKAAGLRAIGIVVNPEIWCTVFRALPSRHTRVRCT